jgi:hypothetical protein
MNILDWKTNTDIVNWVANNIVLLLMIGSFCRVIYKKTNWKWLGTILEAAKASINVARGNSSKEKEERISEGIKQKSSTTE